MLKFLVSVSAAALVAVTAACSDGPAEQAAAQSVATGDLQSAVKDADARAFYEARNWQAAWNDEQAQALRKTLAEAPRHGLTAGDFLRDLDAATSPQAREAALTAAALKYAATLANGRIDPKAVAKLYTLPRPKVDVAGGLSNALSEGDVGAWLASLAPQDAEYQALSEAYLRFSKQAAEGGRAQIPGGEAIRAGESDDRVPAIAKALGQLGYGGQQQGEEGSVPGARYTPAMADAVKQLQADYGLKADGIVGGSTLDVLNGGAAERARTLAINLERRRWLERNPPAHRIDVNTAAAALAYYRDGKIVDQRRVVVGQSGWETPRLGSPIMRLVANPPWHVPKSIEEDELAGKSAAYLRANNFSRKNGRLVQAAGPKSALGLVKFDMDNPHAIYLHDTPAKALFNEDERHRSHGCVRVQDAIGFARMIAEQQDKLDAFNKALASGKETFIDLAQNIPVRLLYQTAYVDNGKVRFAPDAYGWDEDLADALGMEKRSRRTAVTHSADTGP